MNLPIAVVFDFDGVIVDSERLHYQTMVEAMEGEGPPFDWAFYRDRLMGYDDRGAFAALLERAGIAPTKKEIGRRIARKAERFSRRAAAGGVPAYPGAVEMVRACASAGQVGLCSGALWSDVDPVLESLGVADCFAVRTTAEDVAQSKPDPEGYALCVARLAARFPGAGIRAGACAAIEDTVDGIASARGAGLAVLGVATNLPADFLRAAGAGVVVESLAEVSPRDLARLFGG
jgi:beta-phosphoglucomutase